MHIETKTETEAKGEILPADDASTAHTVTQTDRRERPETRDCN